MFRKFCSLSCFSYSTPAYQSIYTFCGIWCKNGYFASRWQADNESFLSVQILVLEECTPTQYITHTIDTQWWTWTKLTKKCGQHLQRCVRSRVGLCDLAGSLAKLEVEWVQFPFWRHLNNDPYCTHGADCWWKWLAWATKVGCCFIGEGHAVHIGPWRCTLYPTVLVCSYTVSGPVQCCAHFSHESNSPPQSSGQHSSPGRAVYWWSLSCLSVHSYHA